MATIPELLEGHVTLEVECLDRLYLNGYIGKLATGPGLVMFLREQLQKPVPSPVVLGHITEKFREAVKTFAEREQIPIHPFQHKEDKDEIGNEFRRKRGIRDGVVFIGVAQEKAHAFNGKKVNGQFQFDRDKTVYVNHYYFYIDDEIADRSLSRSAAMRRGPSSCASTGTNGPSANWKSAGSPSKPWTMDSCPARNRRNSS
jgi:hypothetical protein